MPNLKTQGQLAEKIEAFAKAERELALQNKILDLAADNDDVDMFFEAQNKIQKLEAELRRIPL